MNEASDRKDFCCSRIDLRVCGLIINIYGLSVVIAILTDSIQQLYNGAIHVMIGSSMSILIYLVIIAIILAVSFKTLI
jgi:hypothetical protein